MLRDVEIDAAGVGIVARAVVGGQVGVDAPRRRTKAKHALCRVVLHQRRTQHLGQLAIGVAAEHIHLPEAILRGHIALRDEEVLLRGRLDMGHAVDVAAHGHRRGNSVNLEVAIHLRQRGMGRGAQPQQAQRRHQQNKHHKPQRNAQQEARPAAFAASG